MFEPYQRCYSNRNTGNCRERLCNVGAIIEYILSKINISKSREKQG